MQGRFPAGELDGPQYGSAVLIGLADDGWLVQRAEVILVVSWVGVRIL